jgi:hypothetical protein
MIADVVWNILTAIGAVVGIGGSVAGVAYALFRFLGERWLNAKFEERLAAYKHAQQKELEELRFTINALMDRATKLHQKEFEVLPEAWAKLNDAHGITIAVTSAFQQYPDLDRMTEPQLEEFLEKSDLMNWQKDEIRRATKKTEHFVKAVGWQRISEARDACRELHVYLRRNGIFLPEPTKSKFVELDKLIYGALVEHELNQRDDLRPMLREDLKKLNQSGKQLLEALEQDVHGRLWDSQRA